MPAIEPVGAFRVSLDQELKPNFAGNIPELLRSAITEAGITADEVQVIRSDSWHPEQSDSLQSGWVCRNRAVKRSRQRAGAQAILRRLDDRPRLSETGLGDKR